MSRTSPADRIFLGGKWQEPVMSTYDRLLELTDNLLDVN